MIINDVVEHSGVVKLIERNRIIVSLSAQSACGSCAARGLCSVSEVENKDVEIKHSGTNFFIGENVFVFFKKSSAFKALFLGYILPFFLLVICLFTVLIITDNEGLAGLISIASLIPYYFLLYIFRDKIKQSFRFHISKNCNDK